MEDEAQKLHDEKTGRKRWRPEIDENERRASETSETSRLREHRCIRQKEGRKEGRKRGWKEDGRHNMQCLPSYVPASLTDWIDVWLEDPGREWPASELL